MRYTEHITRFITHFAEAAAGITAARDGALESIGAAAESHAKAVCPVDTGRLRASIAHTVTGSSGSTGGIAVIGTNTPYAAYVELGTARQRAQPYLVPALAEHVEEYAALIRAAMENTEGGNE